MKQKLFTDHYFYNTFKKNIVYLLGDQEKARDFLLKKYDVELEIDHKLGGKTFSFPFKGQTFYAIWLKHFSNSILAHEATHLTGFILKDIGSNCPPEDDVMAYMVEYFVRDFAQEYGDWRKKQK